MILRAGLGGKAERAVCFMPGWAIPHRKASDESGCRGGRAFMARLTPLILISGLRSTVPRAKVESLLPVVCLRMDWRGFFLPRGLQR